MSHWYKKKQLNFNTVYTLVAICEDIIYSHISSETCQCLCIFAHTFAAYGLAYDILRYILYFTFVAMVSKTLLKHTPQKSVFNLENIYYFPSCSGGMISLHHFPLDIWKPAFEPAVTYDIGNREEAIQCTLKDNLTAKNGDVSSSTP